MTVAVIRAAGGVLVRDGLIAVVHRPRFDDWTLPKGKLNRGEHPLAAACREVEEETAVRPIAGARLASVSYRLPTGPKAVDYWAMRAGEDLGFTPNQEIDGIDWLDPSAAEVRLSYDRDRKVLASFRELPAALSTVAVVRHATAGRRDAWPGPDSARPLDSSGTGQAAALAGLLCWYAPERLVSSPARRCLQTLSPLAEALDAPIEVDSTFVEEAEPAAAADRLRELAAAGPSTVVSSHGDLLLPTLAALLGERAAVGLPKGTAWILSFASGRVVAADPLVP